jgi:hypothetical protein
MSQRTAYKAVLFCAKEIRSPPRANLPADAGFFMPGDSMVNPVIAYLISQIAGAILGSDIFSRIIGCVERWAEKEISSAEKRHGVLAEIETIGLKLTESAARFGVELAVQYLKRVK